MLATVVALINAVGLPLKALRWGKEVAHMKRIALLVTVALVMAMMVVAMAGAALAVPPQQNDHNCYGYSASSFAHGQDVPAPTPVSGHPGNEVSAFQQGAREELANCGANQGGSNF